MMTTIGKSPEMPCRQRARCLPPAAETRGRRSKLGLGKKWGRQLLKGLHIARADAEPAHLELGMGPRGFKGARASMKLRVALGQPDDGFARIGHHRDERKLKSLVRRDRDAPTQAEDRVEHSAGPVR